MNTQGYFGMLAIAATAFLLVGCGGAWTGPGSLSPSPDQSAPIPEISAFSADQIAVLSESRSVEDQLPEAFFENENLPVVGESTRLLADYDGVRYYVGLSTNPGDVCLMVYGSDSAWGASCSGALPFGSYTHGAGHAQLMAPGGAPLKQAHEMPPSLDWHPVNENLIVSK